MVLRKVFKKLLISFAKISFSKSITLCFHYAPLILLSRHLRQLSSLEKKQLDLSEGKTIITNTTDVQEMFCKLACPRSLIRTSSQL